MNLGSINLSMMVAFGVGWKMESLTYKLIMRVRQLNMEVVQVCVGWMNLRGMGYMSKIKGKMTRTLYLSLLQDGTVSTLLMPYSSLIIILNILQNYSSMQCNAMQITQVVNAKFWCTCYLAFFITWTKSKWACVGVCEMGIKSVFNTNQTNASIVGVCTYKLLSFPSFLSNVESFVIACPVVFKLFCVSKGGGQIIDL